jgi:hypothetical protein
MRAGGERRCPCCPAIASEAEAREADEPHRLGGGLCAAPRGSVKTEIVGEPTGVGSRVIREAGRRVRSTLDRRRIQTQIVIGSVFPASNSMTTRPATENSSTGMPVSLDSRALFPRRWMHPMRSETGAYDVSPNASTVRNSLSSVGLILRASGRHLGALLLGHYTNDGRLVYAGRVGTGIAQTAEWVLRPLRSRQQPHATETSKQRPL